MSNDDRMAATILEREAIVEVIEGSIERAANGAGRLLMVEGASGLGKTVLLDAAGERARALGFTVLAAAGRALEREFPFGAALQLFERAASAETDGDLFAGAAALARPVLTGEAAGPALAGSDDSFSVLHGLYWLTANLADRQPVLVTVDDAQWVDRATLRFLLY